jgi:hypothetical protein
MGLKSIPKRLIGPPSKTLVIKRGTADVVDGFDRAVNGNLAALPEIKRADIVQSHDMVRVRMREQNSIHPFDPRAQCLLTQIGGGVYQDAMTPILHQDRGPEPVIARVVGRAHRAVASDGRDADASARTEHRDAKRLLGHLRVGLSFLLFVTWFGLG